MGTRWIAKLTVLTLAMCFMLIVLGVYLVITQGRDLTAAKAELARTNHETAVRNTGLMYLTASIRETNRFFADVKGLLVSLCGRVADAEGRQPCERLGQQADLLSTFNLAASNRASAQTNAQYEEVVRNYTRAHRFVENYGEFPDRDRLRAIAGEGIAYARYRQGNLSAATTAIRAAHSLDPGSLLIGLTEAKILCARRVDPRLVRSKLNDLKRAPSPSPGPNGEEDRSDVRARIVGEDAELRLVCSYALAG